MMVTISSENLLERLSAYNLVKIEMINHNPQETI